jgi:hypothetical protein
VLLVFHCHLWAGGDTTYGDDIPVVTWRFKLVAGATYNKGLVQATPNSLALGFREGGGRHRLTLSDAFSAIPAFTWLILAYLVHIFCKCPAKSSSTSKRPENEANNEREIKAR